MSDRRKRTSSNGEGGIRPRSDGRYEARYHVEMDGVLKRRSVFGRTRREAGQKLAAALKARNDGVIPTASGKETLGAFLDNWLPTIKASVRPRTLVSYESAVRVHIKPRLGRVLLNRLQPSQVQSFYQSMLNANSSAKTVRNVHMVLHRALEQAVCWGLVSANVTDMVDLPRRQQREMTALSVEDAQKVLTAAKGDDLEAVWWLALTGGMRQGEILGLRWPNIDLDSGTVHVVSTSVRLGKKARELVGWDADEDQRPGEPKSRRSRRRLEPSQSAVAVLRAHRQRVMEDALRKGKSFERNGYVFARENDSPLAVTTTWKEWGRLLKKAGVPYVRPHDARHTAATLLLSKGVHPKLVSEMLGHSTVAITLDTYSHVTPTMHRETARVMDSLFSG